MSLAATIKAVVGQIGGRVGWCIPDIHPLYEGVDDGASRPKIKSVVGISGRRNEKRWDHQPCATNTHQKYGVCM